MPVTFYPRRTLRNVMKSAVSRPKPKGPGVAVAARIPKAARTLTRVTAARIRNYRKRKQNIQKQAPLPAMGGVGTFSQFKLVGRASKRAMVMKRGGAENFYVTSTANQMKVPEGFQGTFTSVHLGKDVLKTIMSKVPPASGSSSLALTKQYLVESSVSEYLLTNSTLATMYVDIYDIVRKRDPGWSATQGDYASPTQLPDTAWSQGVSDEAVEISPDLTAFQNINSLPTDSRLFRDYFRVIKRTHISLSQGATHRHHVALSPKRILDNELLTRANGDIKGLSVYTMICAYGQPVSSPDKEGGPTVVTTASGSIDIVNTSRVKYTFVQDNAVAWFLNDGLSSLADNQQVVSAGAGAIVPNASV